MLETKDLAKKYKLNSFLPGRIKYLTAVNQINLQIKEQEILGLIGESGCGKSTLARLLVGLEKPSSGEVIIDGTRLNGCGGKKLIDIRKKIQLMFQDPYSSMNPRLTVGQIIKEPLNNFSSLTLAESEARVCNLLSNVGLPEETRFVYPYELSGGQRQRVALARAIALKPKYLVMDEPLASLDVSIQAQIINLLLDLKNTYDLTYLLISHDLRAVRNLCDKIVVMYCGKIIEVLPHAYLHQALHPYTKLLFTASSFSNLDRLNNWNNSETSKNNLPGHAGCDFYSACPESGEKCLNNQPVLNSFAGGHQVACLKRGA